MLTHTDWLEVVSKTVLQDVSVSMEDYIDTITTPGVPLDFITITVLCRAYHMHIGIFTSDAIWMTSIDKKFESCFFGLVFQGDFEFSETVAVGEGDNYHVWIEDRASKGKMPSHERSFMPGQIKLEDKLEPVPQLFGLKYEYESEPENDDSNSSICEDVEGATAWETEEHSEPDIQEITACPACHFMHVTQKAIISHVKTAHPDFRYPCTVCDKTFVNFNTKYKHEKEHRDPSYFCGECGCGYHYSSELKHHSNVHSTVLPFGCDRCEKCYAQEKSLKIHLQSHNPQEIKCSECDKVVNTEDRLYTHFHGAHGKGYDSLCGQNFQWPGTRSRHQQKCDTCKAILKKRWEQKLAIGHNLRVNLVKLEEDIEIKKEPKSHVKTERPEKKL